MAKLKILFDCSPAYKPTKTGIPFFVKELYNELEKIEDITVEKTLDISQYISRKPHKFFRFFEQLLYHNIYLPLKLKWGKYDVYVENQYMFLPVFTPKNTLIVNMVYDIALILLDNIHTQEHIANWRKQFPKSLHNTDIIITISKSSMHDIQIYLNDINQSQKEIDYIYADICLNQQDKNYAKDTLKKFGIVEEYFLFLGTLEPRKNPLTLVAAFHLFKTQTKSKIKLVFAGQRGWLYDDVMSYIKTHDLENEVLFTGYISDEDKITLLKHTKAFMFLSVYEGFGIPALEAMKLGTPTLLSDIPVFHELFETSALYVDHHNPLDIAQKMEEILKSPPQISPDIFKKFSWESSAYKFVKILKCYNKEYHKL